MGIILFLVFGLVVGVVARAILPGARKMGLLAALQLSVGGSFIGGFIGSLITSHRVLDFNLAGLTGSVIGAVLTLLIAGRAGRRARV